MSFSHFANLFHGPDWNLWGAGFGSHFVALLFIQAQVVDGREKDGRLLTQDSNIPGCHTDDKIESVRSRNLTLSSQAKRGVCIITESHCIALHVIIRDTNSPHEGPNDFVDLSKSNGNFHNMVSGQSD